MTGQIAVAVCRVKRKECHHDKAQWRIRMLYGQSLCLWKTQGMEKKLGAASNQGSSKPPGACSSGEHLYPGSLVAPTKPRAAGVTDIGLLVPRRITSV